MAEVGFQVYEEAPLAVKVTGPAAHKATGDAVIEIDGAGFTLTITVSLAIQPKPLSPSTV